MQIFVESPEQKYGIADGQPCFLIHKKESKIKIIYPPIVNEITVQGNLTLYDLIGLLVIKGSFGTVGYRKYKVVECNGICLISPTTRINFVSDSIDNCAFGRLSTSNTQTLECSTAILEDSIAGISKGITGGTIECLEGAIEQYKTPLIEKKELEHRINIIKQVYMDYQIYLKTGLPKTIVIHGPQMTGKTFLLKTILSMFPHVYINKQINTEYLHSYCIRKHGIVYGVDINLEMPGFSISTNTNLKPHYIINMKKTFMDHQIEKQMELNLIKKEKEKKITFKDLYGMEKYTSLVKQLVFKSIPKGMLIYGKPGTGKTTLGIAIGNELESFGFIPKFISSTDLISKITGKTEENISKLFKLSKPTCLIIDNFEIIGTRNNRILHCFLNEMDGLKINNVFVLGITRDIKLLDPALIRRKRIDVYIEIQDIDTLSLLKGICRNVDFDLELLVEKLRVKSVGEIVGLVHNVGMDCIRKGKETMDFTDFEPYL
ncbi:AAA ATPase cdc48 [Boothiomyces sp. JEL0838]|nr:AAA ATPase cdc48 [Boothiomyces sp. JEL0838]